MTKEPLSVEHVPGENLVRFLVRSQSRKRDHLVDIESYGGNGQCACENFRFNFEPELSRGVKAVGNELRCVHIKAARRYLGNALVDAWLELRLKQHKHPQHD